MKQAPQKRGACFHRLQMSYAALTPILEFPGFELPRCQRLDAPLFAAVRRPVTETRPFLDLGLDDARRIAALMLPRRLADDIDEFRLVGHGPLLAKHLALTLGRTVCPQ